MKPILFILGALFFATFSGHAHPAFGLVVEPDGTIYFSTILKYDGALCRVTPGGEVEVLVDGQHSHFIFQDAHGTIYGTDHDYLPATENNRNELWKWTEDGGKEILIGPTTDPEIFSGVNFTVDSKGNFYYNWNDTIFWQQPDGHIEAYVDRPFEVINTLQMDGDDNLYVIDRVSNGGTIYRIKPDRTIEIVGRDLLEKNPPNPPFPEERFNMFYAAHIDQAGNVYVANAGSRRITAIRASGNIEHIYHSNEPYYPVAYYRQGGNDYIMESGYIGRIGNIGPRVVKISNDERTIVADLDDGAYLKYESTPEKRKIDRGSIQKPWMIGGAVGFLVIFLGLIIWRSRNK